ncbi:PIN domain nuclease [Bacillus sp. V3-13]|uniref:PIN domain-containing protein n=1 Tax=Bacillus sp. V3-13 TaxID=2053728 RepID=UPI000C7792AA|nr:PIN domain-containing protein [Bacillus sp. V3-13]PLR79469.1 PIN domain nuclease [Bacillus sp. V3-13]
MNNRMIVDANVLLRIATGQPEEMASIAFQLFVSIQNKEIDKKLIVPTMVVAECCWVLKGVYQFDRFKVKDGLIKIFSLPFIELEESIVIEALENFANHNVDFIDAYLALKSVDTPLITWNAKHFKRLGCEFYSPAEILNIHG